MAASDTPTPLPRVATGVPGLDTVLNGGMVQGSVYMVTGAPGTGKTTLANQVCMHQVQQGVRAVYVTLLGESHSRLFTYLQGFSFFRRDLIGGPLRYFSAYTELEQHGLAGLTQLLTQLVRQERPGILVLDGFETIKYVADSTLALKRFMHQLQALSEFSNTTTLLLAQPTDATYTPEHTMVDGTIQLHEHMQGVRRVSTLEVRKLRGSSYMNGQHVFRLTDDGMVIHPRTEALLHPALPTAMMHNERLSMGVARLDDMLQGGVLHGSTTLLLGTPGAGKTLLGLHFLAAGAERGERGLYFGLFEQPQYVIHKAAQINLPFPTYVADGLLHVAWKSGREGILDVYAEQLLALVRQHNMRRVVIDGLDGMLFAAYAERLPEFLLALTDELRALGVTMLVTAGMTQLFGPTIELPVMNVSAMVDNIVLLRYVELRSQLYRLVSILKVRDSQYDSAIREFVINHDGIDVAATFASAEAILTGVARPVLGGAAEPPRARRKRPAAPGGTDPEHDA